MKRVSRVVLLALLILNPAKPLGYCQETHQNVVLIYADDLGWGDLGCYGHPRFKTPELDRMAAEGVRFTQFYSTCGYCAPSRAALLTGRYQFRSGVVRNPAPDAGIDDVGIPDTELTLGEAFQKAGYQTACIGKWHLGHREEFFPTRHGFHEYLGILYSNDMRPVELVEDGTVIESPVIQATLTERYTDRAIDFMTRYRDQPFFLYLPHAMPHKPLAASEAYYKQSGSGLYGDVISELDSNIGRLLNAIKKLGLAGKTLVVFTSDNGPSFGGSTGGLRGMKGSSWEGGIRVPMIAWAPNRIESGQVVETPAATIDLFDTTLASANVSPKSSWPKRDGQSLWPIQTEAIRKMTERPLFSMLRDRLMSIRVGNWKLHVHRPTSRAKLSPDAAWVDRRAPDGVTIIAPFEQFHPSQYPGIYDPAGKAMSLYHLANDPSESENLASRYPEVVSRLKAAYDEMQVEATKAITSKSTKTGNGSTEWIHPNVVQPQGDDTIELKGMLAHLKGDKILWETPPHKRTIGYWVDPTASATWTFRVKRSGTYRCEIVQGCGRGNGGSRVRVSTAGQELRFIVEETGHFQNFLTRDIGSFTFDHPGVYTLEVMPETKPGKAVMDLRIVTLRPIR